MHDRRDVRFFQVAERAYLYRVIVADQHKDRTRVALDWLETRCPRRSKQWDYRPLDMYMMSDDWGVSWNDITDVEFVFDDPELAFEFKLRWG
ncbi:MAG: hypothetical protein EOP83_14685 [Verrucomicrobiaceae bacterium]|nr:MAG: hypothetical protein EOP83_14685 [Verrucomicrobiaceae bacterium]